MNQIIKSLIENKFSFFISRGCFDIIAKKNYKMLIKTSFNLDGLTEEHALSLRSISYFTSAYPLIVSVKTNRNFLKDKIIYSRFKLPVVTPGMFNFLIKEERIPFLEARKGKLLALIDCKILKERRNALGLSLSELSSLVGISKKSLYKIENEKARPTFETVEKIESILKVNLKKNFKLEIGEPAYLRPKNNFQRVISKEFQRLGIESTCVYSAPFEIVGREKFPILTRLFNNTEEIRKCYKNLERICSFLSSKPILITKRKEKRINLPIFTEEEIREIENIKEFEKFLEEFEVKNYQN